MKEINRTGMPSSEPTPTPTPGGVSGKQATAQTPLQSTALKDLLFEESDPLRGALADRERLAYDALDRAVAAGVFVERPKSPTLGQTSVAKLSSSLEIMSRAAAKKGPAENALTDPGKMRINKSMTATSKSDNVIAMANIIAILETSMPTDERSDKAMDVAKKASKLTITVEVFTTARKAAAKVPNKTDPAMWSKIEADMQPINILLRRLRPEDIGQQERLSFDILMSRLNSLELPEHNESMTNALKSCAFYVSRLINSSSLAEDLRHELAGSTILRRSLVLANPQLPQANWTRWAAKTPEHKVVKGRLTARATMLLEAERGPRNTLDAKIPGWTIYEYELTRKSRAFVASRNEADTSQKGKNTVKRDHVVLFIDSKHIDAKKGEATDAYIEMIQQQYNPTTDDFKNGKI